MGKANDKNSLYIHFMYIIYIYIHEDCARQSMITDNQHMLIKCLENEQLISGFRKPLFLVRLTQKSPKKRMDWVSPFSLLWQAASCYPFLFSFRYSVCDISHLDLNKLSRLRSGITHISGFHVRTVFATRDKADSGHAGVL